MNYIKLIIDIFYGLLILFLIGIAGLITASSLDQANGLKFYTVQSGSMEPALPVGSLLISQPRPVYHQGDIITFKSTVERFARNPKITTTHRIADIKNNNGKQQFVTKGDANASPDIEAIDPELVLGKVVFSIPLMGYPVAFARTQTGLIILIIIPATVIIYSELLTIRKEAKKLIRERRKRKLSALESAEIVIGQEVMALEKEAHVLEEGVKNEVLAVEKKVMPTTTKKTKKS